MTPIADMIAEMMAVGASQEAILAAVRSCERSESTRRDRKRERDAEHQRNKRTRDRAPRSPDLFERSADDETRYGDAGIAEDVACQSSQPSQSDSADKRNPHKENTSFVRTQEVNNATLPRARDPDPLVSEEAYNMAEAIGREAGFEPWDTPPGWCGAADYLQSFLNSGLSANHIRIACTTVLRRRVAAGRGPPEEFGYFRKPVADICADLRREVPKVETHALEVINGGKSNARTRAYDDGRPRSRNLGSATDAAAELREYFTRCAEEDERTAQSVDRGPGRIPDGRIPEG
jgi:hypothetical protein